MYHNNVLHQIHIRLTRHDQCQDIIWVSAFKITAEKHELCHPSERSRQRCDDILKIKKYDHSELVTVHQHRRNKNVC